MTVTIWGDTPLILSLAGYGPKQTAPLYSLEELTGRPSTYDTKVSFLQALPSVQFATVDKTRIVMMGQKHYSVGTVKVWSGCDVVELTPGATGARWTPAFVGRRMRIASGDKMEEVSFAVLEYLDANRLRIGFEFDPVFESWRSYAGATATTLPYVIEGYRNRFWWTAVTRNGIHPEYTSLVGYRDIDMSDDYLVGAVHAGEYLLIVSRKGVFRTLQQTALDDALQSAYPLVEPLGGYGCIAQRTLTDLPDSKAMWLGEGCKIIAADSTGSFVHPASAALEGFLTKKFGAAITAQGLTHSHAQFVKHLNAWILYLIPWQAGAAAMGGEYVSSIDSSTTALATTFGIAVAVDLQRGAVYPLDGYNFTCTSSSPIASMTPGVRSDSYWGAGEDGYLYEIARPDLPGLMGRDRLLNPSVNHYRITGGAAGSATIDSSTGLLPASPNALYNLEVRKVGASSEEDRLTNGTSASTAFVTANWTATPVAGDELILAPLDWRVVFKELRSPGPMRPVALWFNVQRTALRTRTVESTPKLTVEIYAASGAGSNAVLTTPAATLSVTHEELSASNGRIALPPVSSRAIAIGLSGTKYDVERIDIESVQLEIAMQGGKGGGPR